MVADHVAQELEKIEDDVDAHEGQHHDRQVKKPVADDVDIQDLENTVARLPRPEQSMVGREVSAAKAPLDDNAEAPLGVFEPLLGKLHPRPHPAHRQHQDSHHAKNHVRPPQAQRGVEAALLREAQSKRHHDVVNEDQQDSEDHAHRFAAFAMRETERDPDQRQDQRRHRQGKAVIQLDQSGALLAWIPPELDQPPERHQGRCESLRGRVAALIHSVGMISLPSSTP